MIITPLLLATFIYYFFHLAVWFSQINKEIKQNVVVYNTAIAQVTCYLYFQLKGTSGYGVEALKRHPKVRSVTPQKRVERFLRSVQGKVHFSIFLFLFLPSSICNA